MGTRHIIGVVKGGEWKIAQYGQWDGYPGGQGIKVLKFLRNADLDDFSEKLDLCRFGTKEEIKDAYRQFTSDQGMMNLTQARDFSKSRYWHLSRDTGADILAVVASAVEEVLLQDDLDFVCDGLMCEWAYVVDMDKRTFEIYEGFKQTPVPADQRFAYMNEQAEREDEKQYQKYCQQAREENLGHDPERRSMYYPVHLRYMYSFDNLPEEDQFIVDCQDTADEDEDGELTAES